MKPPFSEPFGDRGHAPLADPAHHRFLEQNAAAQLRFFEASLRPDGRIAVLDFDGRPLPGDLLELHTTCRLVHSYALGIGFGHPGASRIVDAGMEALLALHRDREHGGYVWSVGGDAGSAGVKLAYGHAFVLLAAAGAMKIAHPDAPRLLDDVCDVIDRHYWDEAFGLMRDEFTFDWQPFSRYRGMNANMHSAEAFLAAYEATGRETFLRRAGSILDFFVRRVAPDRNWRIAEHYRDDWTVDDHYRGDPMFRPAGTTPGHSFELARLALQYFDLTGRADETWPVAARRLVDRALADAWDEERGGLAYTLGFDGRVDVADRYWWPVTEAIGALAQIMRAAPGPADEIWYRRLWSFASERFVDHERGGWYPELGEDGHPVSRQFRGKPDIYHSLQAALIPLVPSLSRLPEGLAARSKSRAH